MQAVWGNITAEQIMASIGGSLKSGDPDTVLKGISTDSRTTQAGDLFWALRGDTYDGHDFAPKALEAGAIAVVVERGRALSARPGKGLDFGDSPPADRVVISVEDTLTALGDLASWWRHQHRHHIQLVGITGSSGKTTTKEMTAAILGLGQNTLKNQGNFNNLIGLPLTLLKLTRNHECAVLEMGMNRPGEIARLTDIADPDVGVILNVGMAHLEGLLDLEGVADAKTELMDRIASKGLVILNGDDALLIQRAARFSKRTMTFGVGPGNDVRATHIENRGTAGTRFSLEYQGSTWPLQLRLPGFHHLKNALAAAAITLGLHQPPEHIIQGLRMFQGIKGRFQVISLPGDVTLVDDTYNANPSSFAAAMESVASLGSGGRIIVGLGDMLELGDVTAKAHREAGRQVAEGGAFALFVIGAHGRDVLEGARMAGMPQHRMTTVDAHGDMTDRIAGMMSEGDLILLKGSRRMKLEKVVEGLRARADHLSP